MFKNKKVIIFDMDGTLIDSVGIWNEVDSKLISKFGNKKDEDLVAIQMQRDKSLSEFSKTENPYLEYAKVLNEKYDFKMDAEDVVKERYEISQEYLKNIVDYKPNADVFIKELKNRNFILIIASTTRRKNIEIYMHDNKNIIEKADLATYFNEIYTREDAKKIKPNPEIYLTVVQQFGVKKEDCIIVEDSLIGIQAAYNAGIESIAIYDKYSDNERNEINSMATYKAQDYEELIEKLKEEIEL